MIIEQVSEKNTLTEPEATEIAQQKCRFTVGTRVFITDPTINQITYSYDYTINYTPHLHMKLQDDIFYEDQEVGSIHISFSGILQMTEIENIEENIQTVKSEVQKGNIPES